MSSCDWCGTYWDCDGEGGECPPGPAGEIGLEIARAAGGNPPTDVPPWPPKGIPDNVKPAESGDPADSDYQIKDVVLLMGDGGELKLVLVQAFCTGDVHKAPLIKLNGCRVPALDHGGGNGPPHPERPWKINCKFDCPEWGVPPVRVQAYTYDGKLNDPPTDGCSPKIWLDQLSL